jgi:DNA-directed RNA polymerase subunit RPC12/RpoP
METKFVCLVCQSVFPEHQARADSPLDDFGEGLIRCPTCGSARIELDHFDPDEPIENPLEEPDQEGGSL